MQQRRIASVISSIVCDKPIIVGINRCITRGGGSNDGSGIRPKLSRELHRNSDWAGGRIIESIHIACHGIGGSNVDLSTDLQVRHTLRFVSHSTTRPLSAFPCSCILCSIDLQNMRTVIGIALAIRNSSTSFGEIPLGINIIRNIIGRIGRKRSQHIIRHVKIFRLAQLCKCCRCGISVASSRCISKQVVVGRGIGKRQRPSIIRTATSIAC